MSIEEMKNAIKEFVDRVDCNTERGERALSFLYGAAMRFARNAAVGRKKGGAI